MKKLMLGLMMAFAVTADAETVTYLDYDVSSGTFTNATVECTVVTSETTAFADGGWYVAKGTNTCAGTITVSGSAHLILADGAELTVGEGIRVAEGNSLAIYGQDEGGGKLIAERDFGKSGIYFECPGIGGGAPGESCGAITVNGGIVVANQDGGIGGACGTDPLLGGDADGGDGGSLTVNGGWVIASKIGGGEACKFSAPFGGGGAGSPGRGTVVTFMGGVTEAESGIFTDGDPIIATNMMVTGMFNAPSSIKVAKLEQGASNVRDVVFVLGEGVVGITTDFTGDCQTKGNRVTLKEVEVGAQIRIEVTCALGFEYRGETEFVVRTGESPHVLNATPSEMFESLEYAVPGESALSVAKNVFIVTSRLDKFTDGGWYAVVGTKTCGTITVEGSANLILADGAELTVNGGIRVTEGNSLTIYGQSEGSGRLIATGAVGCAGIGGGAGSNGADGYWDYDVKGSYGGSGESCGAVTINGGMVTAMGGTGAAGIGGGAGGAAGSAGTVISGIEITVRSGGYAGADGGAGGSGGTLTINDGKVTLIGGNGAAGIGGGVGGIGGAGSFGGGYGNNGTNGAGATVTFLGGVTEAQNGIFTKGDPIVGEGMKAKGSFNVAAKIVVLDVFGLPFGHEDRPWEAGASVTAWTNGTGRLTIEGTGAMYDFEDATDVPWAAAADKVTAVTVADTVTHVGENALAGFTDAVTVNGTPISFYDMVASARGSSEPVIPDDKVLVAKEELQAAKAEAVSIADGVVSLGVTVNTNGNFTAETKSWAPVELKQENVEVKDGKVVISIPVSDKSGFMILQSGDAKVGAGKPD